MNAIDPTDKAFKTSFWLGRKGYLMKLLEIGTSCEAKPLPDDIGLVPVSGAGGFPKAGLSGDERDAPATITAVRRKTKFITVRTVASGCR